MFKKGKDLFVLGITRIIFKVKTTQKRSQNPHLMIDKTIYDLIYVVGDLETFYTIDELRGFVRWTKKSHP